MARYDRERILKAANLYLLETPVTVTAQQCERSMGGLHDFYSEGDYWWPDPENPDGPYIRKDGQTNPDNFTAHRKAMRNLTIDSVYTRKNVPKVDWSKAELSGNTITQDGRPVFLLDHTWKPETNQLNSKADGNIGSIFIDHTNIPS